MPGETPDYARLNAETITFPVTDLGELAARIGSIDRYDRRGDVVDLWDFEGGLGGWTAAVQGTGALADLSLLRARSGMLSCRLLAGAAAGDFARIERAVPIPSSGLPGIEGAFSMAGAPHALELRLRWSPQGSVYEYALRHRHLQQDLQVLDDAGVYQTAAVVPALSAAYPGWSGFKMVVDLNALRYERALFNQTAVDLSAYSPLLSTVGSAAFSVVRVQAEATTTFTGTYYVDDVIFTQGEPPN